jgi:phytanoyl-CoA hydroxylase
VSVGAFCPDKTLERRGGQAMTLTQEQLDFFSTNGYLVYGKVLEEDEIERLRCEYDRVFEEARLDGRYRNLAMDDTEDIEAKRSAPIQMLQVMQMCERSLDFRRLLYNSRILNIVEDLLGPNIMLFHDQALFKPALTGGPVFWHQDNAYWRCSPANLISCWLTLDDVVKENGAMQMIPGSHLQPVRHEQSEDTNALLKMSGIEESKAQVVELPAGGCMFHHCQTLHHTAPNTTEHQRRAFAIHFMTPGTKSQKGETMRVSYARPMLRMCI